MLSISNSPISPWGVRAIAFFVTVNSFRDLSVCRTTADRKRSRRRRSFVAERAKLLRTRGLRARTLIAIIISLIRDLPPASSFLRLRVIYWRINKRLANRWLVVALPRLSLSWNVSPRLEPRRTSKNISSSARGSPLVAAPPEINALWPVTLAAFPGGSRIPIVIEI